MKTTIVILCGMIIAAAALAAHGSAPITTDPNFRTEWATIVPREFTGAINNPLKGFRDYKPGGY